VPCLHDGLLPQRQHADARGHRDDGCGTRARGRGSAAASLFRRSVAQSIWALLEEAPKMRRLARRRQRSAAGASAVDPALRYGSYPGG
jgi:hypothetical protein